MLKKTNKYGQEELVGFALIIIVVSIVILGFLFFVLRTDKKQSIESYEVESFVQASLQYTTECIDSYENLSLKDVVFECVYDKNCIDGKPSCEILNSTLKNMVGSSWLVSKNSPVKGYTLLISSNDQEVLTVKEGNETQIYKGSLQDFSKGSNNVKISFRVYY